MNLPSLLPVKPQDIKQYLPYAVALTLKHPLPTTGTTPAAGTTHTPALTRSEKATISRIYTNLNAICKLSLKQVKELLKQEPDYQDCLADLYFQKTINNYILITKHQKPTEPAQPPLLEQQGQLGQVSGSKVIDVQYRIEFTISNIAKKNVMKPVVLLVFSLKNGGKQSVYFNLQQFGQLRQKVSHSMRQIYGVELRAL